LLAAPAIGSAQTAISSAPLPASPAPIVLFKDTLPESTNRSIESLKSSSWWEAPADNSEIPRWTIGNTVTFKTAGGLAWSAGLFGRRADPLPLFLSQGISRNAQRLVSNSVTDPSTYRLQWDAQLGLSVPVSDGPKLTINGIGEVFVPLGSMDAAPGASKFKLKEPLFSQSPAFRLGVVSVF
jgi:hypothetical protein